MDRNYYCDHDTDWIRASLSARRAWIEIASEVVTEPLILVALRKESVDRNPENPMISVNEVRRSPQGERG